MRVEGAGLLSSSGRVALIAIDAVVNVVPHTLMVRVRLALGVAIRA